MLKYLVVFVSVMMLVACAPQKQALLGDLGENSQYTQSHYHAAKNFMELTHGSSLSALSQSEITDIMLTVTNIDRVNEDQRSRARSIAAKIVPKYFSPQLIKKLVTEAYAKTFTEEELRNMRRPVEKMIRRKGKEIIFDKDESIAVQRYLQLRGQYKHNLMAECASKVVEIAPQYKKELSYALRTEGIILPE